MVADHESPATLSVREAIWKFNGLGRITSSALMPFNLYKKTQSTPSTSSASRSTTTDDVSSPNDIEQAKADTQSASSSSPAMVREQLPAETRSNSIHDQFYPIDIDDRGLEVIEPIVLPDETMLYAPSIIDAYGETDMHVQEEHTYPPLPPPRIPLPPLPASTSLPKEALHQRRRTLPLSNFLIEIGALVVIFILCMVLVLAIREDQAELRVTMQMAYTYIYVVSIIWMVWCVFDIIKFRRQWMVLTASAHDQEEYMDIVERSSQNISYFPDIYNTGGLFMRAGAGLFCMGSLLLTFIELARTIETMRVGPSARASSSNTYSQAASIAKSITFICRFLFHCVQFLFLFRYGNIVIDRCRSIAKVGLIHLIIANFCTWFEAIVNETLEELHKNSHVTVSTYAPLVLNRTTTPSSENTAGFRDHVGSLNVLRAALAPAESSLNETSANPTSVLSVIERMESTMGAYLYPCLIEYSLISVTVFYIMWRNVGQRKKRSYVHFSDRHIYTVNCSRASYGLLAGGLIFLLTVLTLIPDYMLEPVYAVPITHVTELVLLLTSLIVVCATFLFTTKLYYDQQAHENTFDHILILVTTVGDFAYCFFGLFASVFTTSYTLGIPRGIEISISIIAILQTYLQSAFLLDTLKRRLMTKNEFRRKPGRELITALLLINLAIWLHDSLSAKKVKLNPVQAEYYDVGTWSIVQAFTSPLSIFYRFHSSVCLADIWQEVYHDSWQEDSHRGVAPHDNEQSHSR